ncbi:MAG: hypothetical protein ABSH03_06885 [Candidatus Lustribacter sp.]|jgi:hypothetical protein
MARVASSFAIVALTAAFTAAAFAQAPAPTTRIRGTISSFAGGVLTVAGAASTYKVTIPDNARIQWIVKSDLASIGPNTYVGTVAVPQPDGSLRATEVQIFPEALRGVGEGSRPWDTIPNSSMTNATVETIAPQTVDKVSGQTLMVKYKDTEKKVFVPANAPIITYVTADKSALTPGAHVIINATTAADGTLATTGVQVGKDGLVPPM